MKDRDVLPPPAGEGGRSEAETGWVGLEASRAAVGSPSPSHPVATRPPSPEGEGKGGIDLSHLDAWIFDLDDTLYPREQGVMRLIEKRINAFMITATGLEPEAALVLQKRFLNEHGTTLAGLMANYAIDPQHFLDDVHDVPLDSLEPNPALASLIAGLPGKKIVFTNGAQGHAARVMDKVGLSGLFDDVFAIEDADLLPKPAPATFQRLVERNGVDPRRAIFFEDTPRNLKTGHDMGMTTVLVGRPDVEPADFIDYHTPTLTDFLTALPQRDAA